MGASMRSFVQSFAGSMFMHLFIPADATPLEFSVSIKKWRNIELLAKYSYAIS